MLEYVAFVAPPAVVFALGVAVALKRLLVGRTFLTKKSGQFFGD